MLVNFNFDKHVNVIKKSSEKKKSLDYPEYFHNLSKIMKMNR